MDFLQSIPGFRGQNLGLTLGIHVYKEYLHRALKSIDDVTYIGLFGSLGLGLRVQCNFAAASSMVNPMTRLLQETWRVGLFRETLEIP